MVGVRKIFIDVPWLEEHYVSEKLSLRECSALAGCSISTVRIRVIEAGIPLRPPAPFKQKEIICEVCGKVFSRVPHEIARRGHHYCSHKCDYEAKSRKVVVKCDSCGAEFSKQHKWIGRVNHHFCRQECFGDWVSKTMVGRNHPNWIEGKQRNYCYKFNSKLKEEVRNAFGRKCYLCGTPENGRKLAVHHVDYNKSQGCRGMKWALLPLCINCHALTTNHRFLYFHLLRDYWIYDIIDFTSKIGGFETC